MVVVPIRFSNTYVGSVVGINYLESESATVREEIKKRMELLVHNGLGGLAGRLLLWAAGMGLDNETIDKELQAVIDKYNKHSSNLFSRKQQIYP